MFTVLETIVSVWRMLRSHHRAYTRVVSWVGLTPPINPAQDTSSHIHRHT